LLDGGVIGSHEQMPVRKRPKASVALLTAAATALGVKAAVATPLGAAAGPQIDQLKENAAALVPKLVAGNPVAESKPAAAPKPPEQSSQAETPVRTEPGGEHPYTDAYVRKLLTAAAHRHNLDAKLVLAISYWESGWDQGRVSGAGAQGLMQVQPDTAKEYGPALLHRQVDLNNPYDNADVGAAIFRRYLDAFGDTRTALAAYNQGPTSIQREGIYPETEVYVDGILSLAQRM
jgi:soluble lytic murein transglycosylase-like protein